MYKLEQLSGLHFDALVTNAESRLMFVSVYGRSGQIQQLLAAFHLPAEQGGFNQFTVKAVTSDATEKLSRTIYVGDAKNLQKMTGRMSRGLFGEVVHAFIYDPIIAKLDKSNRRTWLFDVGADANAAHPDKVWPMVKALSPVPLLEHWRDDVFEHGIKLFNSQTHGDWPNDRGVPFAIGAIDAWQLQLIDGFEDVISDLVKRGVLTLEPTAKASIDCDVVPDAQRVANLPHYC